MRIVFAGTPDFAAVALAALSAAGHEIVLVLAQPDRPSGRGLAVRPGPVAELAAAGGLPLIQPRGLRIGGRFDDDARAAHERIASTPHDVMVVAAYGLILPPGLLALPPHGCINIHASLLPRWRGAAPVQRAIEAGDGETGITIMRMDAGLDTGDILATVRTPIQSEDSGGTLTARLATLGGAAIVEALAALEAGTLAARPQHPPEDASEVTYAAKLTKAEGVLDFAAPTRVLVDRIRAFDPWPGCTATLVDSAQSAPKPYKIWAARPASAASGAPGAILAVDHSGVTVATGDGALVVTVLQAPGGRRLDGGQARAAFAGNGRRFLSV